VTDRRKERDIARARGGEREKEILKEREREIEREEL
jgi:hypothetical protein